MNRENHLTVCRATRQMIAKAGRDGVSTMFDRVRGRRTCAFGSGGTCCRICAMGPCQVRENGPGAGSGVCGATPATIAARNFGRMIAAGTAAHCDHAREVIATALEALHSENAIHSVRDPEKVRTLAGVLGLTPKDTGPGGPAGQIVAMLKSEFGKQEGELVFVGRAPAKRREIWHRLGVIPRGIDREVVEMLHRTSVGVDQDFEHLMLQGMRTALADGWGGSMIATELQDVLFGTPRPTRGRVNLGVLREDQVNIVVHGHEPMLPMAVVEAARDEDLLARARDAGARGINVVGICCTANELLMRQGVPVAGSVLQQELAIITGAVDLMMVDVQCVMQGLANVAACYHTALVTTSPRARIEGVAHIEFDPAHADKTARELIIKAVENFPRRGVVEIPREEMDVVAGFSHEAIRYILGGRFRAGYGPLNENIINGRIRGVAAVVGCSNPRVRFGDLHTAVVRELIANNVLVLTTGCAAINCAKEGLLVPEAADLAGSGLREVCEAVGIPPVLHCGSCVDNSRLLVAATEMVRQGGLGDDIADLPLAGCAPEWMSEKAIAIGQYFVTSGVTVGFGVGFPALGSERFSRFLLEDIASLTGGRWFFEPDPMRMARRIIEHIDARRRGLGIEQARERVLFDMEMRRQIGAG